MFPILYKERVFSAADKFFYLSKNRTENGKFIDDLVAQDDIGGVLEQFMKKGEIRTYIKDPLLNRYSKDKTRASQTKDIVKIIKFKYGFKSNLIDSDKTAKIRLYKCLFNTSKSDYVVVAEGTLLKWVTALRKALYYIPSKPFSDDSENTIHILLNIFAQHKPVPLADKKFLNKALARCSAQTHIFGDGYL